MLKAEAFNNEDPKFILRSKRIQYSRNYIGAIPFGYFFSPEKSLTILLIFFLFCLFTIASGYTMT
jgi:hypothetical protein